MRAFHSRWRRQVSLLAAGALAEDHGERGRVQAHLEQCRACRDELSSLVAALRILDEEPPLPAGPPVPVGALLARVNARLDEVGRPARGGRWRPVLLAAGVAAVAVTAGVTAARLRPGPGSVPARSVTAPAVTAPSEPDVATADSDELLRRMERNLSREQTARYLNEAQDVLVTLAATPQRCPRGASRVDVGEEARRSRELLARRALLVDPHGDEVASARPVLDDVEHMLREVAALQSCARRRDLESLHQEMQRRHLLMKIDLMTRELQG